MAERVNYPLIGIAGAARSGKDTLCKALINEFKKRQIEAKRISIAGDLIKKDLYKVIKKNTNISTFTVNDREKQIIRPMLVEYGRLMRKITQGRYFIEKLANNKQFNKNTINIITDIRYTEYPKDELYWIKEEVNGFLIFMERNGVLDANDFEKQNNLTIRTKADIKMYLPNCRNEKELNDLMDKEAKIVINKYFNFLTTYQQDTSLPLNRF
jgi:phosphoribulokinase